MILSSYKKNIKKNYVKLIVLNSFVFLFFLIFIVDLVEKNNNIQEISLTNFKHTCNVTLNDFSNEISGLNQLEINTSAYELDLIRNPGLIKCLNKVLSVEVNDNAINVGIGSSSGFFNVMSFIYIFIFFHSISNKEKIFVLLNLVLIKQIFLNPIGLRLYLIEIVSMVLLSYVLYKIRISKITSSLINNKNYIEKIDVLRAIAVLFVIFNHFNKEIMPHGYLGVDIFFVISGFVITNSLKNYSESSYIQFYKKFLYRRFKRIYPVLLFIISIFLILINFYDLNIKNTFFTGMSSLFAFSNIYLFFESSEYFSSVSSYNSFLHTWSLGIEEQFYLLFPIVFFLFKKNKKKLKNVILLISIISVFAFIEQYDKNFLAAYYLPQYRFWEISFGSLLTFISPRRNKFIYSMSLFLLFITMFLNIENSPFLHLSTVLLTSVFIIFINSKSFIDSGLNTEIFKKIGLISYSIYLWHLPINISFKWMNIEINIFLYFSIVLILSFLTYKYIEFPNRNNVRLDFKTKTYLVVAVVSIFMLNPFDEEEFKSTNLENKSYKATFREIYCHVPRELENLNECFSNDKQEEVINLYLIGDSHISNHLQPLKNILSADTYNVELFVDFGLMKYFTSNVSNCPNRYCLDNAYGKVTDFFKQKLDSNDIVIFSLARDRLMMGDSLPRTKIKNENNKALEIALKELKKIIVDEKNATLYLIDDIPKPCLGLDLNFYRDILELGDKNACYISSDRSKDDRKILSEILQELSTLSGVYYYDPHDYLCFNNSCNLIHEKLLIFADTSPHLTSDANKFLEKFWETIFVKK